MKIVAIKVFKIYILCFILHCRTKYILHFIERNNEKYHKATLS